MEIVMSSLRCWLALQVFELEFTPNAFLSMFFFFLIIFQAS